MYKNCRCTPCNHTPPMVCLCWNCSKEIYEGDCTYNINEEIWCEDCVQDYGSDTDAYIPNYYD